MKLLDVNKATAEKMRAEYWKKYGTSLAGLMQNYEIDPNDFLKVVHDIDFSVLPKDIDLLDVAYISMEMSEIFEEYDVMPDEYGIA